jgi:hypothetical protein
MTACRDKQTPLGSKLNGDLDTSVLARQGIILKNLSIRIQTAEAALNRYRQLDAFYQQQLSQNLRAKANTPKAPQPITENDPSNGQEGDSQSAKEEEDSNEEENEEPSEEEEEKKRKADIEEQNKLINYVEATKTFLRYRPDDKCGGKVPELPDDGVVECNPKGDNPCCSNLGWCGNTKAHCQCPLCTDYRKPKEERE